MSYIKDQRWHGHYELSNEKEIKINLNTSWSIELWLNLKVFPEVGKSLIQSTNRLMSKPMLIKYNEQLLFINGTQIKYIPNEWFQLIIVSGSNDSLSQDNVRVYINGKLANNSISAPTKITSIKFKPNHMQKNKKERGSMLGLARFYNKSLDKYQILNNYHASASRFGLELPDRITPYTKYGLIKTMPPDESMDKKIRKKITTNNYMNNSEIHELSKLFASQPTYSKQIWKPKRPKQKRCTKSIQKQGPNIISILNSNPEVFMRMLQNTRSDITRTTVPVVQEKQLTEEEATSIFSDPVKVELLTSYFKQNPKALITILNTNLLTSGQLSQLKSSFVSLDSDEFHNYNADLEEALLLLDITSNRKQNPRTESKSMPLESVEDSLSRIAQMMNHDRRKKQITKQISSKKELLSSIKRLNLSTLSTATKLDKLEKILAKQSEILGLVVSQKNGKCVGAIKKNGKIKHTPGSDKTEVSPYNIILNTKQYQVNMKNILNQHQLQNQTIKNLVSLSQKNNLQIVGQCVNRNYQTIAAIVIYNKENHYLPTILSKPYPGLPILAMIDANKEQNMSEAENLDEVSGEEAVSSEAVSSEAISEAVSEAVSETVSETSSREKAAVGKCEHGYEPAQPNIASKGWLSHLNKAESEESTSSLFAYTSLFK